MTYPGEFLNKIMGYMKAHTVLPIKIKDYTARQSIIDGVGRLPIRRISLGSSRSGQTVLLHKMILKIYKGCFERICMF